jgi:AcrR family transcriptional regulator
VPASNAALKPTNAFTTQNAQIDRIAEAAGSSRSSFYFHFPAKDDVIRELQRRRANDITERFRQQAPAPDSTPQSIKEFLEITMDAVLTQAEFEDDPDLIREVLALQIRHPDEESRNNPVVKFVYNYFKRASELGQVRDDISPSELTKGFMNCVFELLKEVSENSENHRDSCNSIIKIFVRGVSP